jgi:predicted ATPase/class 3 adenylate cyclase
VTVLFADLAGFTALSARLDPEDVRALQTELYHEMTGAVEEYGGFVEKYVGDAVMAVFGAPLAHEDDPERALRAALEMHDRVGVLSRRWERRLGQTLALHLGVNGGPVVAGNLGAATGAAYAVTGDTVNTAARLQGAAKPGETLVSRAVYLLTQHAFTFELLPDLSVKGKTEPLAVYRLLGSHHAPRSARGLEAHGLAAALVGRDAELAQLQAAFDRMRGGHAQVVSLVGDAGAGKSRLVRELLATLSERGDLGTTTVRQMTCSLLGEQTYGVLGAFMRQAYGVSPADTLEAARAKVLAGLRSVGGSEDEVASIAPLVGHVLGFEGARVEPGDVEPEQLKRRLFLAARALFERRLEQGPLLLVVEDLQWADRASVEVLRFVVDRLVDRRLILVVTQRPDFDAAPLAGSRANHTSLRLAPLAGADSRAILRGFFSASLDGWPTALLDLVVARAGGNPFYLEEIVRGLIDANALVRDGASWRCRPDVGAADVPPTIQALLLSRLDRLPPHARRLLQEAAVLGHVFDARLLRLIASESTDLDASLDLLVEAELVEEVTSADRRYRFKHALVHEVVYQNLLQRRRSELHGRAGHALEDLCEGRPERLEDLEMLGRHFSLSAELARGARYLTAAGDRARAIYANEDAIRHYERALATLDGCDGCDVERLVTRERLGDLLGLTGVREAALAHYEAVLAALAAAGDRPGQARLHRKIADLHWSAGDRERALRSCQTGLALLEEHERHIELAHLCQEMGRMAFRAGDNQRALEWAERALAHAEALAAAVGADGGTDEARKEVTAALVHAHNTIGIALARMGKSQEAVGYIERSGKLAEGEGLFAAACRSYSNLAVLYGTLDPARAIETCQHGLDLAKKTGDVAFQSRLYANLAVAYCTLTNRCDDQGISAAQTAIELDRRLGQLDHLAVPLIVLAQIYQCHGQPRLALTHFREALELAEQAGDPQLLFPCYDGLAALHLETGDDAQADEYMQKAQEICERTGLDPESFVILPFLE